MPITSIPDHVAVAVPAIETAATRWRDELGGGWAMPRFPLEDAGFATRQLRYRGDAKLELLEPLGPDTFAGRFVTRYGASVHHLTLKVPALLPAMQAVRDAGYDIVDVFAEGDIWHEAFLRPSQVGGMIVQLAWAGRSDAEWAELAGIAPEAPAPDGAILRGPTLTSPDLGAARTLWRLLGAEVDDHDGALRAWWPGSPARRAPRPGRAGRVRGPARRRRPTVGGRRGTRSRDAGAAQLNRTAAARSLARQWVHIDPVGADAPTVAMIRTR